MDKVLINLITQLNLDTNYFKQKFDKVSVKRIIHKQQENLTYIYLKFDKKINKDSYLALLKIEEAFPNKACRIFVEHNLSLEFDKKDLQNIFNDILLPIHPSKELKDRCKIDNVDIKGELVYFFTTKNIEKKALSKCSTKFNELLKKIGINKTILFDHKVDYKTQSEIEKENLKYQESIIKKAREVKKENGEAKAKEEKPTKKYRNAYEYVPLKDVSVEDFNVIVRGKIFDSRTTDRKRFIATFYINDYSDSLIIKGMESSRLDKETLSSFKNGQWIEAKGKMEYDNYLNEEVLRINAIKEIDGKDYEPKIFDNAPKKRIELHTHSKMSLMDGLNNASEYVEFAHKLGHSAVGLCDHGIVQAFPDAFGAAKKLDMKVLYGMEAYVVKEEDKHVYNAKDIDLENATYVVFDLETTGLSSRLDDIIEIGAVKVKDGMVLEEFQTFVNPQREIPHKTFQITGIKDSMLKDAPKIEKALKEFLKFSKDSILVAHNASFDIGFLKESIDRLGFEKLSNPSIDTLTLSRFLYKGSRSHSLGNVARRMGIEYDEEIAHRGDYDAKVLFQVFEIMLREIIDKYNVVNLKKVNTLQNDDSVLRQRPTHMTIFAKNQQGLKDLYKLVSISMLDYFKDYPRVPRKLLEKYRKNLLIGSACQKGDVFDTAITKSKNELKEVIEFYDFIEVQPLGNYSNLIDTNQVDSKEKLKKFLTFIIKEAKNSNKLVVATSDAHYLVENEKQFRDIYIHSQAPGGKHHPLYDFKKRIKNFPDQHFRTTDEMLNEFSFLDEDLAFEIVVENSNKIADSIDKIEPLKEGTYAPKMDGAEEKLKKLCFNKAYKIYGKELPKIVLDRINKELNSIITNNFAVIYYISHLLVKRSLEDGYIVGSRGSVGSSLVAFLTDITEVNSLKAHYICENCQYSDFSDFNNIYNGYDLPEKNCPKCGMPLRGDGHNIPFETFLGFKGDKVPDIDLNFSGEYQPKAHEYTRELFGKDYVYRAGTILTVGEKTAFGYVKNYLESSNKSETTRRAHLNYLVKNCQEVKTSTSQHPGGIIVIPDDMEVYDFTPIQYPAEDIGASWKTTHFDFHAIHDNVLKLDILGHVDPTALRMLQDLTGIEPNDVPCNDEKVLSLFSSPKALGVSENKIFNQTGATGIPEFGTGFVKAMLEKAKPNTFAELVQISGLSHGTDVWRGNAEELIKNKTCDLMSVIGCRDDIMVYLMDKGMEPQLSFQITEKVRKGKGVKKEYEEEMKKHGVPEWYIQSCKKIKYMFPKAHAAAYVTMAVKVAWFKVYKPLEYYAAYFSTRVDRFDVEAMVNGKEAVLDRFLEIKTRLEDNQTKNDVSAKEKAVLASLESSLEMIERGFSFKNIDLYKSDSSKFIIDKDSNKLIPPFSSIDGLGENVAIRIINEREKGKFLSIEDLQNRTSLNTTVVSKMEKMGVFKKMQKKNQLELDLF